MSRKSKFLSAKAVEYAKFDPARIWNIKTSIKSNEINKIKKALPKKSPQRCNRLFDGDGLYLEVPEVGRHRWRFKYRFNGKEKRISLGVFPDVSLQTAREATAAARRLLASGVDPSKKRKDEKREKKKKAAETFESVAREWMGKQVWSDSHREKVLARFVNDVFPALGKRPVSEISRFDVLEVIQKIEDRGAVDTAHRTLGSCGDVFIYGVNTGRCGSDVTIDLGKALKKAVSGNFSAATTPEKAAGILRMLDGYTGTLTVMAALRLAPLVFLRPGELRTAKWSEIDFQKHEWTLQLSKQIEGKPDRWHTVPLSKQAIEILTELHAVTGRGMWAFPGARSALRCMSENAITAALRRMGIDKEEMSGHGFRAMARTIMSEQLHCRTDLIEHQLGHLVKDANGNAYNRTTFLPERHLMMQLWADYLEALKEGKSEAFSTERSIDQITAGKSGFAV
jgi:integrase